METQVPPARRVRANASARMHALQHEIMELILERGLAPGDPLPTEHELVEVLGVGRNTVREALKVLQAMGIVDVRHGYGMFVAIKNMDALAAALEFHARLSLRSSGHEAVELVDVRQALESGLIGSAMDAMTEDALAAVRTAVEDMERLAEAGQMLTEADERFHRSLFEPLENGMLTNLLSVFWSAYSRMHEQMDGSGAELAETARLHREIYEAVAAGDKAAATVLVGGHFDGIRRLIADTVGS